MNPEQTTQFHIYIKLGQTTKLVHLHFLKQEYGVSVQDMWMAWTDDFNSKSHGDTALEAVQNMVNSYIEYIDFKEEMDRGFKAAFAKFRTPVIG